MHLKILSVEWRPFYPEGRWVNICEISSDHFDHVEWYDLVNKIYTKLLIPGEFLEESMSILVTMVPADGLTSLGAMPSAGTGDKVPFPYNYRTSTYRLPIPKGISIQFDQNSKCFGLKWAQVISRKFTHIMSVLLSWCVQNFLVINQICYEQVHRISNSIEILLVGQAAWLSCVFYFDG